MSRSWIVVLCWAIALPTVYAKDIYVKAGASGDGSTKSSPMGGVDEALRTAYSGDVIHVARGDYFGNGGFGKFTIDKPDITLVGGYNDTFSQRNPFKYITRLMRGASPDKRDCVNTPKCGKILTRQKVPVTKASYNAKGILVGEKNHKGAVVDGFVIDGYTRHAYKSSNNPNDLNRKKGPLGTACVSFNKPGVKFRNNIIVNCAGPGIFMNALGTKLPKKDKGEAGADWAEITNNIIVNTTMQSIDFRVGNMDKKNAPDGGAALVKNNTLAFNWTMSGENYNLLIGRQTRLTVKDNLMMFAGLAMNNGFGNNKLRLIGNVFGQNTHSDGLYRFWDLKTKGTPIMDAPAKLKGKTCKKMYACSKQSTGNQYADVTLKKFDQHFFNTFMNQIASTGGGKVTMDHMNKWRSALGMNLQGSKGSGRKNFAPMYDVGADWSQITSFCDLQAGKGAKCNGPFQTYKSTAAAVDTSSIEFTEFAAADLKRGAKGFNALSGKPDGMYIAVPVKIGSQDMSAYYMPASTGVSRKAGWLCFKNKGYNIFLYVKSGSEALEAIKQAKSEGIEITIKGKAFDISPLIKASGKVGIQVMEAETNDDD